MWKRNVLAPVKILKKWIASKEVVLTILLRVLKYYFYFSDVYFLFEFPSVQYDVVALHNLNHSNECPNINPQEQLSGVMAWPSLSDARLEILGIPTDRWPC